MILVEKHNLKNTKFLEEATFQSKNLYNSCLFIIRQHFFDTKKYIGFKCLYDSITKEQIWNECNLPKKVCNAIVRQVDTNFKSFFKALKTYLKNPSKFKGKPKIPQYKDSEKGRNILLYEKGAISKREFKLGFISPSQTPLRIKTKIKDWDSLKQVRILPRGYYVTVEVVYEKTSKPKIQSDNYAAIDLGVNNLATISFSNGKNPFIVNGKPLKSINQFYNKRKSHLQSKLKPNIKSSHGIIKLTTKRNNKITDYLHKSSRYIVNQLVSKNISKLIIGYNKQWKQDINIGKKNNQNFTNIPFYKFIQMLSYKCELEGIEVLTHEESYTSKCSFLDQEEIKKHESYMGRRIERGLFKSSKGKLINADLNGSYNIMRKVVPNVFTNGIEDVAVHPRLISI